MPDWTYKGKVFGEDDVGDNIGFVYKIDNTKNGKSYIGKKLFQFTKTKKVKGKRKRFKTPSGWQEYFGSNKPLLADVEEFGKEYFKREILHLCQSKGIMNYLEMKEQIIYNVLESDQFYNDWISTKVHRSHIRRLKS